MSQSRRRRDSPSPFDKIADHALGAVVSFVFTTALIGGSSYLLFQLQSEVQNVDRQKQEFTNRETRIRQFNDMLQVFGAGWFADPGNWQPETEFVRDLPRNISAPSLNQTSRDAILNWTTASLLRLSSERGSIDGFVLSNDLERSLQQQLSRIYAIRINLMMQLEEMVRHWEEEQPRRRDERLATMQALRSESISDLKGLFQKYRQLQDQGASEREQLRGIRDELDRQLTNIFIKRWLAGGGIALGLLMMILVGRAVIARGYWK